MTAYFSRTVYRLIVSALALVTVTFPTSALSQNTDRGVPYLTLRNTTDKTTPDDFYGDARSTLKAGWCGIDQTSFSALKSLADAAPFRIPDEFLRVNRIEQSSTRTVFDQLATSSEDAPLLLYIHGYFIDFEKGCRRATILQENTGLEDRFLWFSWPSDGSLLNYARDEADLYWSVPYIADAISQMETRFGGARVNLAAHSLGARGLVLALSALAMEDPNLRLGNVILLAADMDFEIFQQHLPRIRPIVRSITVYTAEADRPLGVSEQFHGYPRLGQTGNNVAQLGGVEVIDLSDLQVRSPTGHLYHVYNSELGRDIFQIVNDDKPASARLNLQQAEGNFWRMQRVD